MGVLTYVEGFCIVGEAIEEDVTVDLRSLTINDEQHMSRRGVVLVASQAPGQ